MTAHWNPTLAKSAMHAWKPGYAHHVGIIKSRLVRKKYHGLKATEITVSGKKRWCVKSEQVHNLRHRLDT
jgi:hypothetical protein